MTPSALTLPSRVTVADCWARDGLQNEPRFITTQAKVAVIDAIVESGIEQVEVVSFASPKATPQFADAADVLRQMQRREGMLVRCVIPNMRGLERAIACTQDGWGVDAVGFPLSASEAHNIANLNRTHAEHMPELEGITRRAKDEGFQVVASVSTAFGCPLTGDVPRAQVLEFVTFFRDIGVDWLMLGDTTGMANPRDAYEMHVLSAQIAPTVRLIGHFHDTRGNGMANCFAALLAGVTCFDACMGGVGGQPAGGQQRYHDGETGNVSTEDLVHMLAEMGIQTGIDLETLLSAGRLAETAMGRPLRSQVLATGPVHRHSA
jgi:hydroxymethylglutaryl-CoA lyase